MSYMDRLTARYAHAIVIAILIGPLLWPWLRWSLAAIFAAAWLLTWDERDQDKADTEALRITTEGRWN